MSVRAYRINKIETEADCSFNLWQDTELMDYLEEKEAITGCRDENGGQIEVSVSVLKDAVETLELESFIKEALLADIKWAEEKGDDYVQYYCY